jgi:hypothetical protein
MIDKPDTACVDSVNSEFGWVIQFHEAYDGFNAGDILHLDEAGLCIYLLLWCSESRNAN